MTASSGSPQARADHIRDQRAEWCAPAAWCGYGLPAQRRPDHDTERDTDVEKP